MLVGWRWKDGHREPLTWNPQPGPGSVEAGSYGKVSNNGTVPNVVPFGSWNYSGGLDGGATAIALAGPPDGSESTMGRVVPEREMPAPKER